MIQLEKKRGGVVDCIRSLMLEIADVKNNSFTDGYPL
jgi:hypothetical protein